MRLALVLVVCAACSEGSTSPDAGDALPPVPNLSESVAIGSAAVYQAVKAPFLEDGVRMDPPPIPIIANRPALVRVWPKISANPGRTLAGELHLFDVDGNPTKTLTEKKKLVQPADDAVLASSFNFNVPPDLFASDAQFQIVIRDPAYGARPEASIRFPADGSLDRFAGKTDSAELKVRLLPIQYDFDGSHRVPATDASAVQAYSDFLYRMYPVSKVTITVHDPYTWDTVLAADGTGWDNLLLTVYTIRSQEKTPKDVYVVAVFNPAPTWAAYCQNGCQGGIGFLNATTDPAMRIVEMVGYQEEYLYGTLNQELAHDMGRLHAPCGSPMQVDPSYPYKDGTIGKWGWDILKNELVEPATTNDFLSYCQPVFVSDYTYKGLYDQMAVVTSTLGTKSVSPPRKWRVALVDPQGNLGWSRTIEWGGPITETRRVRLNGVRTIDAPYWDLPTIHRGIVLVPEDAARGTRITW